VSKGHEKTIVLRKSNIRYTGRVRFVELPPAEYCVRPQRFKPRDELDVAARFAMPKGGAERPSSFGGITTMRDAFFNVRLELFVDFAIQTIAAKNVG
jgi:hypothetical protein